MNKIYVFLLFSQLISFSVRADSPQLVYVPLDKPCRIVDTRGFATPFDKPANRTTQSFLAWGDGATLNPQRDVSGSQELGDCQPLSGLMPHAMAANITVAAKRYQSKGNVAVYPDGAETPLSSAVNFDRNNIASSSIVSLSPENPKHFEITARLFGNEVDNQHKADVIIDVSGFFYPQSLLVDAAHPPGLTYVPLPAPCRIVDTRGFDSPFDRASQIKQSFRAWGSVDELDPQRDVDGSETLPACEPYPGATPAVMVANVTVAAKRFKSRGNIIAFPAGVDEPNSSLLNFSANNIANTALITLNTEGDNHFDILARIGLQDDHQYKAHVAVDVVGYFYPSAAFDHLSGRPDLTYRPLAEPCRLVDTRGFSSPFDETERASQSFLGSGSVEQLNVQRDRAGGKACRSSGDGSSSLVGTMTAIAKGHHSRGNLVAYPFGTTAPESSLVNFNSNNIANSLISPLIDGESGRFEIKAQLFGKEAGNKRKVDLVVDVTGYFVPLEVIEDAALEVIEDAALKVCIQDTLGIAHDVTPSLDQLRDLQRLNCDNRGVSNLNGLSNLTALTYLTLHNNQLSDVTGLSNLTALTYLRLENNQLSDVTGLSNLPALTSLRLDNNQLSDVTGLSNLPALTSLTLHYNQISDVTGLSNLPALTYLTLYNNQLSDVTGLSNLTALTYLGLENNQISDVTGLSNLTALTSLSLYNNQLSDVTGLSNLTALTYLRLQNNQLSDVTGLSNLTALTYLYLDNNQLSDVTGLSNLTALTYLGLGGNQLSDVTGLSNLTALTDLGLGGNQLSDVTGLSNLTALTYLRLENNPIIDCSPVAHVPNLSGC